jgi:hypothetical protein
MHWMYFALFNWMYLKNVMENICDMKDCQIGHIFVFGLSENVYIWHCRKQIHKAY